MSGPTGHDAAPDPRLRAGGGADGAGRAAEAEEAERAGRQDRTGKDDRAGRQDRTGKDDRVDTTDIADTADTANTADMANKAGTVDKAAQRAAARQARRAVPTATRAAAAEAIADRLWPLLADAGVVLAYAALPEEVSLDPLIRRLIRDGRTVALPRVTGEGTLDLHRTDDLQDLVVGAFGVREPEPAQPLVEPGDIDVVLVPGVAFDRTGRRLGYGGGYYDRLLPRLVRARRVGVCLEAQLVPAVAAEAHDQRVGSVVTEVGMYP